MSAVPSPPSISRQRAWAIFGVAAAGFFLSMYFRVSSGVVGPQLAADFGLDTAGLGLLAAIFFYAFAAAQIPIGLALDRFGPRRVMAVLGVCAVAGSLLFAAAGNAWWAGAGRILLGIGMAGNFMGALILLARWFPPDTFATMAGLLSAVGSLGMTLAATPLAWAVHALGWRMTFVLSAGVAAVQVAVMWRVVRDRPHGQASMAATAAATATPRPMARLVRRLDFWCVNLATFFRYGVFMALPGLWLSPFLTTGLGIERLAAGNLLALLSVGYVLALPLSGLLSDRWWRRRKAVVVPGLVLQAASVLGLILLRPGDSLVWVGLCLLTFGVAAAAGQIMYVHMKELVPEAMAATAMTGVNLFTMLGPAMLLQLSGLLAGGTPEALADASAYLPVWLLFGLGLVAATVGYLLVAEHRPGDAPRD